MERKKILILTLGTGNLDEATEKAGYKMTQYTIEGKPYQKQGVEKETSFVAEPIIDYFEPDSIFILGTVKSVWHQFYATATTKDNEDDSYRNDANYKRLVEIETANGITTDSETLRLFQKEITDIFAGIKNWGKYSDKYKASAPEVHILLTKYGINSDELKENYSILKSIENYLSEDTAYEVAFDITHSFRSLPVYNLVIFNYIKNVTKYDIIISHIYYGNIDASHELGGKAPIVDLKDLVDVLNLTNGVTEFKNTGNAISLLALTSRKDELRSILRDFDLATQLNAFGNIRSSLSKLESVVDRPASENRYTGVREMIKTVLQEKFKMGSEAPFSAFSDADLKFMLSWWFFNQNRMGLGLATGLEALRDINTPAFMKARGLTEGGERKYRENAEKYFIDVAERLANKPVGSRSSLENVVCSLGRKLPTYKVIRNVFAHSLENSQDVSPVEIRDAINRFRNDLTKLKNEYDRNYEEYCNLFARNRFPKTKSSSDNCRIVIDFGGKSNDSFYRSLLKSSASKTCYDVYRMRDEVRDSFFQGMKREDYPVVEKAYFLEEYLKARIPNSYKNIQIILCDCDDKGVKLIFEAFLEQIDISDSNVALFGFAEKQIVACKKTQLCISMSDCQEKLSKQGDAYANAMGYPLLQYCDENENIQDN